MARRQEPADYLDVASSVPSGPSNHVPSAAGIVNQFSYHFAVKKSLADISFGKFVVIHLVQCMESELILVSQNRAPCPLGDDVEMQFKCPTLRGL